MAELNSLERKVSTDHQFQLPADHLGFSLITSFQLNNDHIKMLLNFAKGDISAKKVKNRLRIQETSNGKSRMIMYTELTPVTLLENPSTMLWLPNKCQKTMVRIQSLTRSPAVIPGEGAAVASIIAKEKRGIYVADAE